MNIEVLARIRPPRRGDLANVNVSGTRVQSSTGTGHIFNSVYPPQSLTYDVYKDSCQPLVDLFVAGYNVCLLVFGETGSGKSYSLAGEKTAKAGLIPLAINGVFLRIKESMDKKETRVQVNQSNLMQITAQCYEVYNEKVRDLLRSPHEVQKVEITEDAPNGVYLDYAIKKRVTDAAECTALFRDSWAARTQSQTDYGQADARAASFFSLDLSMLHKDNPEPYKSRLLIVELPGAEKLAEDPTQLRMREGPSLNKSILAFRQLVATLASSPMAARTVSYSDSVLTHLLEDVIGGNFKTRVLVTLKSTESAALSTVLTIAGQLAQVINYPVINDSFAKGLISHYRATILSLKEDVKAGGRRVGDGGSARIQDLRDQLAKLSNENVKLQEGREQLHRRVLELEAKYTEATNSWKQLSSKLEISDEEKLQVYKNLVDLQLENNRIVEESEADKYELTNRILSLENAVHELDAELGKEKMTADQATEALVLLQQEHKELRDEYLVLKSNHIKVSNEHQQQVTRNEELAIELVSLSSTKDRLQRDKESVEIEKMQEYYSQLRKLASKFSRGTVQEKNDLSKSLVSLRSENLHLEKRLMLSGEDKEGKLDLLRTEHQKELRKLEHRIYKLKEDLKESQASFRESQRKLAGQSAEVITAKAERKRLEEENNKLDQQLKGVSAEYSNRLQQYVHDISVYCGQGSGQQFSLESLNAYIDAMVRKIRDAQEQRVAQLEGRVRELKASITDLMNKHEKLLSAYSVLRFDASESKNDCPFPPGDDYNVFLPSEEELQTAQSREIGKLTRRLHDYERKIKDLTKQLSDVSNSLDETVKERSRQGVDYAVTIDHRAPSTSVEGWGHLRKQLREFTLNTQQDLETERAALMTRCTVAEEEVKYMQEYINTQLKRYQQEIVRLRELLGERGNHVDGMLPLNGHRGYSPNNSWAR